MDSAIIKVRYKGKNIAIVGMPGCFKSTVGKVLSKTLEQMSFLDTDYFYEKKFGITIPQTFETLGEDIFRQRETEVITEAVLTPRMIIATGGGSVLKEANRKILRDNCVVVELAASVSTIFSRIKNSDRRPLLKQLSLEALTDLYNSREQLYKETAHIRIFTDNKHPRYIARELLAKICDD